MENDANGAGASGKRLGAAMLGLLHSHIELFGIESVSYTHLTLPTKRIV